MKVLKFSAKWCSSCKTLQNVIQNSWNPDVVAKIENIDIDADMTTARKYRITSLPTVLIVDYEGVEVIRFNSANITEENVKKYISKSETTE